MRQIQKQIEDLERLDVEITRQPDFYDFWEDAVTRCRTAPLNSFGGPVAYPVPGMEVRDLTFEGLDGTPVKTWLILPPSASVTDKVPVVVHFHGAGCSRGDAFTFAPWILAGCAVLSCDFRMQRGTTGSVTGFDGNIKFGWWILGICDLKKSYQYCVWTDCLRAIRLARETPEIDATRMAVSGASQGGGMALGMAALDPGLALCMADVPSSCQMDERIFQRSGGASGIADYLNVFPDRIDTVSRNLSYFDNLNHASTISCPVLVSCGLKDPVCPPACVYAAYNKITAPKSMAVFPFAGHEGGGGGHELHKFKVVQESFFGITKSGDRGAAL